jgi:nickel-dependent lactate racemase
MRLHLEYGLKHLEIEVRDSSLVSVRPLPPAEPLADVGGAVRAALENPIGFPALRRALTPDDHVTIVVDEHLPRLVDLLIPILEHITAAQVAPSAISLVCPPSVSHQEWSEELSEEFEDIRCEVHAPNDRKQLSYLATMKGGRRLYLNRTTVDADQVVVLSGRGYDPLLGYSGAEGSLFPALSDEATLVELQGHLSMESPGERPWPAQQETMEATWLLGAPFFVQVITGAGDEVLHVLGGLADTSTQGRQLLDARWRQIAPALARTVVASISGDPATQSFNDLAAAAATASRVVQPDGRIILLSDITPRLGSGVEFLRQADDPDQALALLSKEKPVDRAAAFQWAQAARRARIYLLSSLPSETTEELFAVPLEHAGQVARLLQDDGTYLFLADAHKTMAVTA